MERRGDHESVIAGGRYGNRRQRTSQPLAAARRERQWQTSVQSLPPGCAVVTVTNRLVLPTEMPKPGSEACGARRSATQDGTLAASDSV